MSKENKTQDISRRRFIKGAGLAGGMVLGTSTGLLSAAESCDYAKRNESRSGNWPNGRLD